MVQAITRLMGKRHPRSFGKPRAAHPRALKGETQNQRSMLTSGPPVHFAGGIGKKMS
jgi:hypothetical protein